jgi:hypothetical protein
MKVVNQTLFVSVKNEIVCGDGSFKATVEHQIIVGDQGVDVDFVDIHNITFMGMPIEGYKAYNQFKDKMSDMGIDIEKMVDDACVGLIPDSFIAECKAKFEKCKF